MPQGKRKRTSQDFQQLAAALLDLAQSLRNVTELVINNTEILASLHPPAPPAEPPKDPKKEPKCFPISGRS